ncbi:MAG TPA: formylglycine-generating enzyme family protein [Verrucomicrobiae bacterium]|nr:formylglycine-generating enzyme family protein [Verrucomicrobiae bacterium]
MRFGPIIEPSRVERLLLLALVLAGGCERTPSGQQTQASDRAGSSNAAPQAPNSKAESSSMVLLPDGRFTMGDPNEVDATPHEVSVSAFYLDKNLVTQEQFEKLMHENPSRWKGTGNPVEQVRWSDAVRFCNKRSEAEGLKPCYELTTWKCDFGANGYRLPTEAEFEYACRAGTTTPYFCGNTPARLAEFAWFDKNSGGHPRPVGQKQPNAWGLYDICGNLWEWCNDFYQVDYYATAAKEDPRGPAEGKTKVVRGGCWRTSAENCRAGYRYNENPGYADVCFGYDIYGFRCARNAGSNR